jgi:hypothetical protein
MQDPSLPPEITVIPRNPRRHPPIRATELETIAVMNRLKRVQPAFHRMETALEMITASAHLPATCGALMELAQSLIRDRGLPALDRLARRQRTGLICWFCEHCPDIMVNPQLFIWVPSSQRREAADRQREPATPAPLAEPKDEPIREDDQAFAFDSELGPPIDNLMGYSTEDLLRDWVWDPNQ